MNGKNVFGRLDFDNQDPVNQNVQSKFVFQALAFIGNFDFSLTDDIQSSVSKFDDKGLFVDKLEQSGA